MKIVYIGKYFKPFIGGIETVTEQLCHGMYDLGHEVTCFVHNEQKNKKDTFTTNNFKLSKKKCFGQLNSVPLSHWTAKEINNLNPDIVHIHLPNPLPLFMFSKIKAKKIATYHASIVNKGLIGQLYTPIYKKQLQQFDKIILTSADISNSKAFRKLKIKSAKVEIIPLSVSANKHSLKTEGELRKIVFSGRFVAYKGIEYLLQAIKNIDVELTLIGDGPRKNKYIKMINALDINHKVKFIKTLRKCELVQEHLKHDLFVLPSISEAEAFGMSALEAMSVGLPLITTKLDTGVSYVNKDKVTGLSVKPKSSLQLAQAIEKIFSCKKNHQLMSKAALLRSRQLFQHKTFLSKHADLYENIGK